MSKTNQKLGFIDKVLNKRELFIVIAALFALSLALVAEKVAGLKPCKLCLYQRYIYLSIIIVGSLCLKFFRSKLLKYMLAINLVALSILSLYHVLYEKDYIKISPICDSTLQIDNLSREEIKELLIKESYQSCKNPVYILKTISFAELNFYYSCLLLGIFMVRINEKN